MFVVMSGKAKADYGAVFRTMFYQLPTVPAVESITADFEDATWQALYQVLPDVQLRGCVFHFTQAVWRKIQELGIRKRTFLPAAYILSLFEINEATDPPEPLSQLLTYYKRQWMTNSQSFHSPFLSSKFGPTSMSKDGIRG